VTDRPHYRLTLVSTPTDVPDIIRLRGALKRLLRDFNFRCVAAEQLPAANKASDSPVSVEGRADG
jgi:hypothetical protein